MKHVKITAFSIPDAWFQTLNKIWNKGDIFTVGYGSEATETKKLNVTIEIEHPENRPLVDDKAPCDMNYVNEYALVYLYSGERYDESYTYGERMHKPVDQIKEVIKRLKECRMDRQCTVVIRLPSDIVKGKVKDPPCLCILDFEILDGKLHTSGYFRSWDCYAGLPANLAGLQLLIEDIAKEIGVETGKMIFHSKNCHIYKRLYKLVEDLLNQKTHKSIDLIHKV